MLLNFDEEVQKYTGAIQLQLIRLTCQNSELAEALDTANKEIAALKVPLPVQEN